MKNETKNGPLPTKDADPSPERVDPRSGLLRLQKAMRHILRVPKERIQNGTHTRTGTKTEDGPPVGP